MSLSEPLQNMIEATANDIIKNPNKYVDMSVDAMKNTEIAATAEITRASLTPFQ